MHQIGLDEIFAYAKKCVVDLQYVCITPVPTAMTVRAV